MKTGYKVCDAMTESPIIIDLDTTLKSCSKIMANNHVGSLIIKDNGAVKGVVTEQDIVRKAVSLDLNPNTTKVSEIMETEILTIEPDKDIYDALTLMKNKNIRHLPVMDNGMMVGFLTIKDILKIEPQLFELIVEKFELREEERKPINALSEKDGFCEACGRIL